MADRRIKDRNGKDGETNKNKIVGQNVKLVTFTATQSLRRLQMWSDKLSFHCQGKAQRGKVRQGKDAVAGRQEVCAASVFASAAELVYLLKMFFGQLSHSEVLEPAREHPMIKGIIRCESVGLFFVNIGLLGVA